MCYDLYLVRVPAEADPDVAARTLVGSLDEADDAATEANSSGPDVRTLTPRLLAVNPALEPFEPDFAAISKACGVSESEARVDFRHVEINTPESAGTGIQITLYESYAMITVPYWHQGNAAKTVWKEIWRYLEVLERSAALRTFDPQLDRTLHLATDFQAALQSYGGGAEVTADLTHRLNATPRRPWWKFW